MADSKVHDTASITDAEAGTVIVDGPDGVMVSLTPSAAHETADRLHKSASKAEEQLEGKRPPFDDEVAPNLKPRND